MKTPAPEVQLRAYLGRFDPKLQKLIRATRAALRKRFPTANELAYDYTSHVVIGYSPTDRGIESIVALDARTDGVRLYLMQAPRLPDPNKLLLGTGKQARYIRVEAARYLAHPDVEALIVAAVHQASIPLPAKGKGKLLMKSEAAKKSSRPKARKR